MAHEIGLPACPTGSYSATVWEHQLAGTKRHGIGFAVLACDLDSFKAANDIRATAEPVMPGCIVSSIETHHLVGSVAPVALAPGDDLDPLRAVRHRRTPRLPPRP